MAPDVAADTEEEEQKLVERLTMRDERAFNELVRLYEARVRGLVLRILGNEAEAEDLAQEVFVQVFKAIGTFRGDSKLGTWIYRIAVNLAKNRLKYLKTRKAGAQDDIDAALERQNLVPAEGASIAPATAPDVALGERQVDEVVRRAIAALEPSFRECLVLRDLEDLSYEEISAITELPVGTVKSRIHRARAQVRERVERELGERIE
jgi:RNA polymerase sigma-70 factor (ECF subfamily)